MLVRLLLCALLVGATGVASAQTKPATAQQKPAAQQLTPEQRAAIQKQNQELAHTLVPYANQIVKMIDNGQIGQVWDQASEVAKKKVPREQFIKATEAERAKLGTVKSRKPAVMYRRAFDGTGKMPAGTYMNIRYQTVFSKNTKPMSELVSFHLDSDKKWRLTGYTVEELKAPPSK